MKTCSFSNLPFSKFVYTLHIMYTNYCSVYRKAFVWLQWRCRRLSKTTCAWEVILALRRFIFLLWISLRTTNNFPTHLSSQFTTVRVRLLVAGEERYATLDAKLLPRMYSSVPGSEPVCVCAFLTPVGSEWKIFSGIYRHVYLCECLVQYLDDTVKS